MIITAAQIRAGIALLGKKINHVSEDLHLNTSNLTKYLNPKDLSKTEINKSTLDTLYTYLINSRIVFSENDTVGRKPEMDFEVLSGQQGFRTLMDDVYECAKDKDSTIRIINGHPELFIKILGETWYKEHISRMKSVEHKMDFKIIAVRDGGEIASEIAEYRWIEEKDFFNNSVYIYGNTVASIYFDDGEVEIEIFNRKRHAQTWLRQFEIDWHYYKGLN